MKYEGMIIRPPSEARSLLIQITVGCSHNRCTFCGTYKDKSFRIKTDDEVGEDIIEAGRYGPVKRVFLCDGDALIIPQKRLAPIIKAIRDGIPGVERIGTYGNAKSILRKSVEDLRELREKGLGIIYLGVESGSDPVLERVRKGATHDEMVEAGRRVKEAGIVLSVTVLLGIGGRDMSDEHATETARILTEIDPDYAGALTVMVKPGTALHEAVQEGAFELPDTFQCLSELARMIGESHMTKCFFASNHASNYLPIRAHLPEDKEQTVALLNSVIERRDESLLRPEFMRAL